MEKLMHFLRQFFGDDFTAIQIEKPVASTCVFSGVRPAFQIRTLPFHDSCARRPCRCDRTV